MSDQISFVALSAQGEKLTLGHVVVAHTVGARNTLSVEREDMSQGDIVDVNRHRGLGWHVRVGFAGQQGEVHGIGAVEECFWTVGDEAASDHVSTIGQLS